MSGPGTRLGRYELLTLLGAGGMGEVFRARDTLLGRDVAVKILPARWAAEPGRLARFAREAQALAALSHPHILTIYDFGTAGDTMYAVTELLVGQTVRDRLRGGPLPWAEAVAIARAAAEGLAAAHDRGIVHRDVKPDNLFLGPDGVKILDFGLVTHRPEADAGTEDPHLTAEGAAVGTLGYMAPEQAGGETIDGRADIFALGCVLHEMLSGTAPFRRPTSVGTLAATLRDPPPELPACVPGWLVGVVARCLAKDRADRYPFASQVVAALAPLVSTAARPGGASRPAAEPAADPEARRLYLRARFHFEKRTEADFDAARELYREALAVDPGYAAGYTGLAELHCTFGSWGSAPPRATFPLARQLAEKAIELDPQAADAWAVLGFVRAVFGWEWEAADADMRRALAIRPDHPTANIRHSYLHLLRGRFPEALAGMRAARDRDPLSVLTRTNVGAALYYSGRHEEAMTELQTALTMSPRFPSAHYYVGLVRLAMGDLHRAVTAFERAVELSCELPGDLSALGHALAVAGREAEAEEVLARLRVASERRYVPPFYFAFGHLTLGRLAEGYQWLDVALAERDYYLVNLRIDPRVDPYRADPRLARVASAVAGPDNPGENAITGSLAI
jgi:tetratricopeptide (TPR) repeat protein